jgi:hypothetical protein
LVTQTGGASAGVCGGTSGRLPTQLSERALRVVVRSRRSRARRSHQDRPAGCVRGARRGATNWMRTRGSHARQAGRPARLGDGRLGRPRKVTARGLERLPATDRRRTAHHPSGRSSGRKAIAPGSRHRRWIPLPTPLTGWPARPTPRSAALGQARHLVQQFCDLSARPTGTSLLSSVAGSTPRRPALRISHSRARTNARSRRAPSTTPTSSRTRTPSTKAR